MVHNFALYYCAIGSDWDKGSVTREWRKILPELEKAVAFCFVLRVATLRVVVCALVMG